MHRFLIARFTIFVTVLTLTFTVIALDANFWVFWDTFTDDTFIDKGFDVVAETDGEPWAWMPLDFAAGIFTLLFLVLIIYVELSGKRRPCMHIGGEIFWFIILGLIWLAAGFDTIFQNPFIVDSDGGGKHNACNGPGAFPLLRYNCNGYIASAVFDLMNGFLLLGLSIALPIFGRRTTYWDKPTQGNPNSSTV